MKTVYVSDIKSGQIIQGQTFAVSEVKSANDKNGNLYYDLVLIDKTGQIRAKIWNDALSNVDKSALKQGRVVAIDAGVSEFKGVLQLAISRLSAVDETKLDDYLESSTFDSEQMFTDLTSVTQSFTNTDLKALFEAIWGDTELVRKLKYWPAGLSFHHDFRGGLLQHILECLATVEGIVRFYPQADFDLVKAGIIMHDLGKLEEIDATGIIPFYTVKGSVLGHIQIGVGYVDKYMPKSASEKLVMHLKHIILSHHGSKDKGSPVVPATLEAMIVSAADDLSAHAQMGLKGVNEPVAENGMTSYNRWLERWMWAGSRKDFDQDTQVAEAETPAEPAVDAVLVFETE